MTMKLKCPTCKTEIEWSDKYPFRPFCSERCKLIDLGDWASERNSIPAVEPPDDFELEELIDKPPQH